MGVLASDLGGYTPVCNGCGVRLCYDISADAYEETKDYWDNWKCRDCNPNAVGSYAIARYKELKMARSDSHSVYWDGVLVDVLSMDYYAGEILDKATEAITNLTGQLKALTEIVVEVNFDAGPLIDALTEYERQKRLFNQCARRGIFYKGRGQNV